MKRFHFIGWVIILTLWGSTLNAQPVLTDNFISSRLDLTKWDLFPVGGATSSTGSGLQFSLNGAQNYSTVQVFTLYQFSGDFDAQVDFTIGSGWNTSFPVNDTSPQLHGGGITVYLDEPNWMVITRSRFSNSEGFNFYSNVDLGTAPRSQFSPSTATSGSLRIVATGGTYHFLFDQGSGWVELATAPAWNQPVRLFLSASNVNAHVSFSSTLNNFRINSGSIDYQPYQLPSTFLRRPAFMIGGQFVNATLGRYFENLTSYNPMSQLFAQGMSLARGCMTTVSDPDLASNPPAQWHTLGWKNSYWSSLQMMTQLFKDAMAAGMRINACFFLSDGAAGAANQNAPVAWQNLSVVDTAALVEQYMYDTTTYLINQGIQVDLYDIGNEILFGILNFCPGDRLTIPPGIDITRSISYLETSVWPTEATLLTAAIHGVRRADPKARIVLHIESLLSPGMDTAFAFFQTMQSLGVPYDVAAISLPYMDCTNLSGMTAQEYFHRFNYLVNRIASLGKPVYVAENSYPADADPVFNPPMPDFPYTDAGQAAYVNSQLRWASNNQNIIGWTWFYPEWFPGINPSAPINLEVQGFYSDRQTLRPAAAELNVSLPNCPALIYPYSKVFVVSGGEGVVTVTSSGGCPWTAASNAPWISITSPSSGSGNGMVAYGVTANTSGGQRTGTITIAGQTFTVNQSGNFSDVPSDYWAYDYINAIYTAHITTGCSQNPLQYCPEDNVTREQMAAFIVRAVEGEPPSNYCDSGAPFPDVSAGMWSCKYIKNLKELGITTGYGDGTYGPYDLVPREQMAAFIVRAVEGEPASDYCDSGSAFPDVTVEMWSCKYIKRLKELGITTGYGDGTYGPYDPVTRAQMAAFLARAFLGMP